MGMSRSQGYTRIGRPDSGNSYGLTGNSAYQKSLDQMGSFNTFSLGSGSNHFWRRNEAQPQMPDIPRRYAYDDSEQRYQLNIDAATDVADKLKDYGDKLFDVFDNYQPNFQYLGDNATVSDAQLESRLGEATSDYQANADLQQSEYERDMRRMGVNPNSARFAGFGTSNALHKAAGLSAIQNQVRDTAREESWNRNLDVAELGLDTAKTATDGLSSAASVYKVAADMFTDNKIKYDQLNEAARQYDLGYGFKQDEMKLAAQNQAFNQAANRWQNGLVQTYDNNGQWNYRESFDYEY
ncbi:hypothetical protein [Endozoicomonas atrinae]|uniref:hypothetical protein n=1 Tax=Endozoicomonas atrinae TaxID=1333660 RepID=UPI000824BC79|nr:hypothetical protein [Endozoicomonas atrinae]